ncbi:MAG: DHA1 family bicyclomycin/chloramphenicol resistance-like MFS transporter [Oceanospirillaceae bacterium]|jgi:DHA1 family bicyclomycin/chloramphenicol resistance-like MFS transporter
MNNTNNKTASKPCLGPIEFISMFALITSLVALSIDSMLPAFPAIAQSFALADTKDTQLVISTLVLGMVFGELIFGPLSDTKGRKYAILLGMVIFCIGCVIAMNAQTFEGMLIGRAIQGFGVSGPKIASRALIRDQYTGAAMARIMSFIMMFFILVPMIAPSLGQLIITFASWRMIFAFFLLMTVSIAIWFTIRQAETLTKDKRIPFSIKAISKASKKILFEPVIMAYAITAGILFGALLLFIGTAQAIFQDIYAIVEHFPLYFAALASGVGVSSFLNGKLVMRYGMYKLSMSALIALGTFSSLLFIVSMLSDGQPSLFWFMLISFLCFCCIGILFGNLTAMAMETLGDIAGLGASIVASSSSLVSVVFSVIAGRFYNQTTIPLAVGFLCAAGFGIYLVYSAEQRKASM